jgi:hypothetical protein
MVVEVQSSYHSVVPRAWAHIWGEAAAGEA